MDLRCRTLSYQDVSFLRLDVYCEYTDLDVTEPVFGSCKQMWHVRSIWLFDHLGHVYGIHISVKIIQIPTQNPCVRHENERKYLVLVYNIDLPNEDRR